MSAGKRRKLEGLERVTPNENVVQRIVSRLDQRVVGQPTASRAVADSLITFSAGMTEPNMPIGVFLFLGPTGAGKTEMGRTIADYWADGSPDADNLLVVSLSEFTEAHSAMRFTGAPPSYVGREEKPRLTHAWCNRQNRKVIIFDEMDKAHPKVLNVLMEIFDKGHIMARDGEAGDKPIYFPNTLFICTTNAGSQAILETSRKRPMGFGHQTTSDLNQRIEQAALHELSLTFRPEILGRMDKVVFNQLEKEHFHLVLSKFLDQHNLRALQLQQPRIELSREVRDIVVEHAWQQRHENGRSVRRSFRKLVVAQVAKLLETGSIQSDFKVRMEVENNEIVFWAGLDTQRVKDKRSKAIVVAQEQAFSAWEEEDDTGDENAGFGLSKNPSGRPWR